MLSSLRRPFANWRWNRTVDRLYGGRNGSPADPTALRLVLGVGRSGTSWLAAVLSRTPTPLRYLKEPLFHLTPSLRFARTLDHTALGHTPELAGDHPLARAYGLLASPSWPIGLLRAPECKQRDDPDWELCLVKEVHSLLATPGLLRQLGCRCLVLVRNPVHVVDSLLAAQGLGTIYLGNEARYVRKGEFLHRLEPANAEAVRAAFERADDAAHPRLRTVGEKLLTAALVQRSLAETARELACARLLDYESLCRSPARTFREAAEFLSLEWSAEVDEFLATTGSAGGDSNESNPYSVLRDTAHQLQRPMRFLSPDEVAWCEELLVAAGLEPAVGTGSAG